MLSLPSFSGLVEFSRRFLPRPHISHVVFDFDGTLSWLRHGWPEIMFQVFRQYLPHLPSQVERAFHALLLHDILSLNGKASIHQMIRGAERLLERGVQPPDPDHLLQEYQRRLDRVIQQRTDDILSGKACRDDFLVHGARPLLEQLRRRGLTLIILSGSLEARVKQEAALLDLARYFGAHLYGGITDLAQSSKRAVIARLLRDEHLRGQNLLLFGDGPVEIQLAKDAGGLAVAVASDEDRNGSGLMQPQKHQLLAAAGADVLIPDYRDSAALLDSILAPEHLPHIPLRPTPCNHSLNPSTSPG